MIIALTPAANQACRLDPETLSEVPVPTVIAARAVSASTPRVLA
jgi:hypothetical protein